ncbi:protein arginine N-methyltransferase 6 [Pectinophora gossypiella]|uniref:protein arginine N-methyltransferase 6 n=1 Tax=Pectinophora gossypiella TaxID=13191 RepID=UPI00214E60B5|nr:protein arginine N-methyltransferase 6 [Pectinophora gossypiella]XP_049877361.1 protein arginine N-methyltransferase 6 [Pectinophora gossypiella]
MEVDSTQNEYFTSYEDLEVHRLMLEDHPRTEAYKNAIFANKAYLKDKIVMDVGCGTGILSIFCAQAGAKKVYAVEASNLANLAKEVVKENNFENVIEVIHSRVEDVVLPGNIKVDAIVSEWMGFYLFHEGMLDSVFVARDKFLKEDGRMFPETATVYIAPCSIPSLYKSWDDMYGVKMSTFANHLRSSKSNKPEILVVEPQDILGPEEALCWIDLRQFHSEDVNHFEIEHVVAAKKKGAYQGLCLWFDCVFPDVVADDNYISLSTGPRDPPTHWKQTVIVLPQEQEVEVDEPIAFKLDMTRDTNSGRRYNLQLEMLDPEAITHPIGCSCHLTKCILINEYMKNHPEQHGDSAAVNNCIIEEDVIDDDDG